MNRRRFLTGLGVASMSAGGCIETWSRPNSTLLIQNDDDESRRVTVLAYLVIDGSTSEELVSKVETVVPANEELEITNFVNYRIHPSFSIQAKLPRGRTVREDARGRTAKEYVHNDGYPIVVIEARDEVNVKIHYQ